ncbi:MAG: acetamidase/formamidase family protein [Pseudomonadota bacterium]
MTQKTGWVSGSVMGRAGLGGGRSGAHHRLGEAEQGSYHYVYGPYAAPVLTVAPGDTVTVETLDAFGGAVKTEDDLPSAVLNMPFVNPQNGPIALEGATVGDTVAVQILDIAPRGPQPVGTTALIPEFGGLVGTPTTAMLNPPLPERVKKMPVTREGVVFSDRVTLPYEPFIGTLGVSPFMEAVSSLQPDYWGGNMDLPDVAPGAIAYFPVLHDGALVYLGDCHGRQGDGELCGVAVEMAATVEIRIDLIKGWPIPGVRLETETMIMSVGSARPMEDAARMAYRDLIRWLVADYGYDETEAYFLCTQAGRVRLGNMVDPKYTLGAGLLKDHIG